MLRASLLYNPESKLLEFSDYGPDKELWNQILDAKGLEVRGHKLVETTMQ
jgi:hypothetical protein